MTTQDARVPPDIPALLAVLKRHEVEFVLVGSVAVEAWGADVGAPGDLDIVPALDRENLARLGAAMNEVEARSWPVTGEWTNDGDEFRWVEFADDDARRGRPLPPPDPADLSTFDSLFSTIHGALDIVPRIGGTFEDLAPRAALLTVHGIGGVRVTGIADLLDRLTVPRRRKDAPRVAVLRQRQRDLLAGGQG